MRGLTDLRVVGLRLVLALALLAGFPALAGAETRVALVVANSAYEGAPLSNPEVDADLVVPALRAAGFEVEQVVNADLETFDAALNEFAERAEGADIALFYFAGHGFALNDGLVPTSYLMSVDADVTSRSDRVIQAGGIRLDSIIDQVTAAAKTTLVFVDACRNDPRVGRNVGGRGRGLAAVQTAANGDVFVGLSTRLGDIADDGTPGEGSPFARAFAEHIAEPGKNILLAFNEVRVAVEDETGTQRPEIARADIRDPEAVVLAHAGLPEVEPEPEIVGSKGKGSKGLAVLEPVSGGLDEFYAFEAEKDPLDLAIPASIKPLCSYAYPTAGASCRSLAEPAEHECDRLAAYPDYHIESVPGVPAHEVDPLAAIRACEAALADYPNSSRFALLLGRAHELAGNKRLALTNFHRAAVAGEVLAMQFVGDHFRDGNGVEENFDTMKQLYEDAASSNYGPVLLRVGDVYRYFYESTAEATAKREAALAAGEWAAAVPLAFSRSYVDEAAAVALLEEAVKHGEPAAMRRLGEVYAKGEWGLGVDTGKALALYEQAAALGDVNAMAALSSFHGQYGPEPDPERARDWLLKAAEAGDFRAMAQVATNYIDGAGGFEKDAAQALPWIEKLGRSGESGFLDAALKRAIAAGAPDEMVADLFTKLIRSGSPNVERDLEELGPALSTRTTRLIQEKLKAMRLFDGEISGVVDAPTIAAVQDVEEWDSYYLYP